MLAHLLLCSVAEHMERHLAGIVTGTLYEGEGLEIPLISIGFLAMGNGENEKICYYYFNIIFD